MTELIKGGPYIPGNLMNLLEDGQVVFFCGAGVSMKTGLPSFAGLVRHVYDSFGTKPDEIELEALDLPQNVDWDNLDLDKVSLEPSFRHHPKYDKVLELLERPNRHGRTRPEDPSPMRQAVVKRLSKRATSRLDVHRALLTLSKTTRGIRLVTTNFDKRFESAARSLKLGSTLFDAAPKLPVPKFHYWHTCVHIHGAIDSDGRGDQLVLTAADFGRAYLTDRWAARFVTDLFRDFHVVFVGYNLGDPVMNYLVDALAAERTQGRPLKEAYAFAAYDGSSDSAERTERAWQAKNVKPILYADHEKHRLLNETLIEWARIREDPFEARKHIALRDMEGLPDGPDGPATRNVVWSLNDPVAARALADAPPVTDPSMYPKLIAWLDVLQEKGVLDRPVASNQSTAPIAGTKFRMYGPADLDKVGMALCLWIGKHLHAPQVLEWLLRRGGHLHPYLRDEIRMRLADKTLVDDPNLTIDPRLRLMWTILVNQQTKDSRADLWLPDQFKLADDAEKAAIVQVAMQTIAPRYIVAPGASSEFGWKIYDPKAPDPDPIEACAHLELVVGNQDDLEMAEDILKQPDVLGPFAFILTDYLAHAVELLRHTGEWHGDTSWDRPSIADHGQNATREKWTELITWVRDAYFQLAKLDRSGAEALLNRWCNMKDMVFHRLVLHALTQNPKSDINLAEPILLKGRNKGLWDDELRRELLRFFRKTGKRLPQGLRIKLIRAILAGPASGRRNSEEPAVRARKRKIGIRLGKLKLAGVRLNKKAEKYAIRVKREKETPESHSDEFNAWIGEVTSGAPDGLGIDHPKQIPTKELAAKISSGACSAQDFEGALRVNLISSLFALIRLARDNEWPIDHWRELVWRIGNTNPDKLGRTRRCALRMLFDAPEVLIRGLGTHLARMLHDVARDVPVADEEKFLRLWGSAWNAVGPTEMKEGRDRMTQALNDSAGILAEAALSRLWMHDPKVNKGFPAAVRPYFDAIDGKPEDLLGRVILVRFLNNLFLIDPDWTQRHLVDPMSNVGTPEAKDLWTAYGYSPRISPNLLSAIKTPFFEILKRYDDEARTDNNLVSMFMSVCLDLPKELTPREIRDVVQGLPEGALVQIAHVFDQRLGIAKEKRATAWSEKVFPWLKAYWPNLAEKNSERTSEALVQMILQTGEAFPDAVDWTLPHLKPIGGRVYYAIKKSEHQISHTDHALKLLDRIVPPDGAIQWEKSYLKQTLDAIKAAKPQLGNNPVFLRLYRTATT